MSSSTDISPQLRDLKKQLDSKTVMLNTVQKEFDAINSFLTPAPEVKAIVEPASITVQAGETVTLDASKSTGQGLKFMWGQPGGTTVKLTDPKNPIISFTAPSNIGDSHKEVDHHLTFTLYVMDSNNKSDHVQAVVMIPGVQVPIPIPPTQKVLFTVDVSNFTSETPANIQSWCNAVKKQADNEGAQYWGGTIEFNVLGPSGLPVQGHAQMGLFKDADQPGDLGWHDNGPNNEPLIKIFTGPTEQAGLSVSSVISHEIMESIGDTNANTTYDGVDDSGKRYLGYLENCDPVESDIYPVDGIEVSDFVTPAWFKLDSSRISPPDNRLDFLGLTTKPFEIHSGGYEERSYDNGATWTTVNKASKRMKLHKVSARKSLYHKKPEDRKKSTFKMQSKANSHDKAN